MQAGHVFRRTPPDGLYAFCSAPRHSVPKPPRYRRRTDTHPHGDDLHCVSCEGVFVLVYEVLSRLLPTAICCYGLMSSRVAPQPSARVISAAKGAEEAGFCPEYRPRSRTTYGSHGSPSTKSTPRSTRRS